MMNPFLLIGALANVALGLVRLLSVRQVLDSSKPVILSADVKRASLVVVSLRGTFLHGLFAALTLSFPEELLSTRLGSLVGAGIGGYLALMALEHFRLPEFKNFGLPLAAPVGAAAYLCAYVL
jgi:hypothetical protein